MRIVNRTIQWAERMAELLEEAQAIKAELASLGGGYRCLVSNLQ